MGPAASAQCHLLWRFTFEPNALASGIYGRIVTFWRPEASANGSQNATVGGKVDGIGRKARGGRREDSPNFVVAGLTNSVNWKNRRSIAAQPRASRPPLAVKSTDPKLERWPSSTLLIWLGSSPHRGKQVVDLFESHHQGERGP